MHALHLPPAPSTRHTQKRKKKKKKRPCPGTCLSACLLLRPPPAILPSPRFPLLSLQALFSHTDGRPKDGQPCGPQTRYSVTGLRCPWRCAASSSSSSPVCSPALACCLSRPTPVRSGRPVNNSPRRRPTRPCCRYWPPCAGPDPSFAPALFFPRGVGVCVCVCLCLCLCVCVRLSACVVCGCVDFQHNGHFCFLGLLVPARARAGPEASFNYLVFHHYYFFYLFFFLSLSSVGSFQSSSTAAAASPREPFPA